MSDPEYLFGPLVLVAAHDAHIQILFFIHIRALRLLTPTDYQLLSSSSSLCHVRAVDLFPLPAHLLVHRTTTILLVYLDPQAASRLARAALLASPRARVQLSRRYWSNLPHRDRVHAGTEGQASQNC